ncbi:hypothetical protein RFI_15947 [Reticulomyxa filosa]|uniref:Viral A-type inclusion protein n=1 Tax=Reticulomyxa filosa TaxID=46433 RepID=X6N5Q1_RETFI|nr:hypothetical protein RFI_15947 [Reticulomyxa filosa]|eukprot:ETO21258.1 hypothetical protein RFI_15947 [Reticulomyxa filosa]
MQLQLIIHMLMLISKLTKTRPKESNNSIKKKKKKKGFSQKDEHMDDESHQKYLVVPADGNTFGSAYGHQIFGYYDPNSGQLYNFGVDPYQGFVPMAPVKRRETQNKLSRRLSKDHRPSLYDLENQKIVLGNYYDAVFYRYFLFFFTDRTKKDYARNVEKQEQEKIHIREELNKKLDPQRRPSVQELGHIGIMDEKTLYQLYGLADDVRKKHKRMESAVEELKSHLDLPHDLGYAISSELLGELVGQKHLSLLYVFNELDPTLTVPANAMSARASKGLHPISETEHATNEDETNANTKTTDRNEEMRYQTLINELHLALEIEKEKVQTTNTAYAQMEAQYQISLNSLSELTTKEKEHVLRIQELENKNNEKYKTILKERDSLKVMVDQLEAQINRQEQYYTKLEQTNNTKLEQTNNTTESKNKNEAIQQFMKQMSEIEQQNLTLEQERDDYLTKSEDTEKQIEIMTEVLQRTEDSKIKLIQETAEHMNQLRYYLKCYNGALAKQGGL